MIRKVAVLAAMLAATACSDMTREPVPETRAAADGAQAIVLGQGYDVESKVLGETRRVNVYTPPGYGKDQRKYPVLYLIDGGVEQDFVHIAGLSQHAWVSGSFRDMIVVGIETKDRRRELAHLAVHDASLRAEYPTHGEAAKFREFIAMEVKPWVEDRYGVDGYDAVMGESLAGLFVVETFLRQPALFDGYIAIDPSMWWDDEALSKEAAGLAASHSGGDRTVFMAVANEGDTLRVGQDRLAEALTAAPPPGLRVVYRPMNDERHSTIYHRAALDALRVVFANPVEAAK